LEIMLVIIIIIALAADVVPNLTGRKATADRGTTQIQMKSIEDALDNFKFEVGRYPTTEEGLNALTNSDAIQDEELVKKWNGPYIGRESENKKDFTLKDAWNHEFKYVSPGEHNTKSFDLYSAGPDGQEGTEDDIKNWDDEDR